MPIRGEEIHVPGKITISRMSSTHGDPWIAISITDARSGCLLTEVKMTPHNFGEALGGLGFVPCEFDFWPNAPIGKIREVKTVTVPFERPSSKDVNRHQFVTVRMKTYLVDGWEMMKWDEYFNHHRHGYDEDGYSVVSMTLERYVDAPQDPDEQLEGEES